MTKQTSIRILGLLLCLAMAMGCFLVVSSAVPSAGTCGENLTWELADGVLTISGTGAMADYNCPSNAAPWYEERKSITSVVLQEGVTSIGSDAFLDCVNLRNITIPEGVASIGSYAFGDCYVLKSLTLPSSVKSIGGGAFMSCKKLNAITVPETSAYFCVIDGVLFNKDCTTILFVPAAKSGTYVIPETVTSIEDHAFDGCRNLTDIILPEGMTSIGYLAFQWCDSLTSITIPEGVTSIPSYAFNYCVRLRSITIPKSVTSIEHNAFLDCRSLKTVCYSGTQEQWDAIAIDSNNGCLTDAQIIVQEAEDPSVISGSCGENLTWELADGVLTISGTGAMADYTCPSNAAPWYEEQSVTIIDVSAFEKCSSLETVYYSGTREQWNAVTIGEENENLMNAALMFINLGAKMKPSLPEGTTVVE